LNASLGFGDTIFLAIDSDGSIGAIDHCRPAIKRRTSSASSL
jgi:hypothetical protein